MVSSEVRSAPFPGTSFVHLPRSHSGTGSRARVGICTLFRYITECNTSEGVYTTEGVRGMGGRQVVYSSSPFLAPPLWPISLANSRLPP